jgi:hypothetical protein
MELALATGPSTGDRRAAGTLQMAAAVAVVALVAFVTSAHVPHAAHTVSAQTPSAVAHGAAPDVPHIAGRVLPVPNQPGTFEAVDPSYRATFAADGITYLPAHATQPLSLSLSDIQHGAHAVALDPENWAGKGSVAERSLGSGIVERITASKRTIEWDVVLQHRLAGTGDLAVTAALDGVASAHAATVAGQSTLRLTLTQGGTVNLGQLVVKDATGAVLYRGLPTVTAGHITLNVPARVLDGAHYPLTIDPTVTNATPVTAPGIRYNPNMAFDGSNYLVVWQEYVAGNYDIYGSIIAADGSGQLPAFRISLKSDSEVAPKVAYTGFRYLVVWQDQFNGTSSTDYDVRGQVLDTLGGTVGSEVAIATPTSRQESPVVAAGSGQFLVAWQDNRPGYYTIYAQRVDTSGNKTGGNFEVTDPRSNGGYSNTAPDIAWNGTVFLAVWQMKFGPLSGSGSYIDMIGVRPVYADGSLGLPTSNSLTLDPIHAFDPAVASDGTSFFCVWEQGSDIYGSRVDLNGVWYTGDDFPISTANDTQDDPAITYNGGVYFVAWRDRRDYPQYSDHDIYAARVKPDGTNMDTSGIAISRFASEEYAAAVAPAPKSKWGVTYVSGPNGSTVINLRTASK